MVLYSESSNLCDVWDSLQKIHPELGRAVSDTPVTLKLWEEQEGLTNDPHRQFSTVEPVVDTNATFYELCFISPLLHRYLYLHTPPMAGMSILILILRYFPSVTSHHKSRWTQRVFAYPRHNPTASGAIATTGTHVERISAHSFVHRISPGIHSTTSDQAARTRAEAICFITPVCRTSC